MESILRTLFEDSAGAIIGRLVGYEIQALQKAKPDEFKQFQQSFNQVTQAMTTLNPQVQQGQIDPALVGKAVVGLIELADKYGFQKL